MTTEQQQCCTEILDFAAEIEPVLGIKIVDDLRSAIATEDEIKFRRATQPLRAFFGARTALAPAILASDYADQINAVGAKQRRATYCRRPLELQELTQDVLRARSMDEAATTANAGMYGACAKFAAECREFHRQRIVPKGGPLGRQ